MPLFDDLLDTANKVGSSSLGERVIYGKGGATDLALARAGGKSTSNAPKPAPEPGGKSVLDFLSANKMFLWIGVAILGALLVFSISRRS